MEEEGTNFGFNLRVVAYDPEFPGRCENPSDIIIDSERKLWAIAGSAGKIELKEIDGQKLMQRGGALMLIDLENDRHVETVAQQLNDLFLQKISRYLNMYRQSERLPEPGQEGLE